MDPQSVLTELLADYGEQPYAELAVITAVQRAAAIVHQAHHWRTRGPLSYSDHLLFERIYNTVNESVDGLAEKTVGLGSHLLVHASTQINQIGALVQLFSGDTAAVDSAEYYPQCSYAVEAQTVTLISLAKNSLESKGQLSDGLDNMLQGILDVHENLIYLLKQRIETQ